MLPLETLGQRIIILGPSNAGKSTLAVALASQLKCEAIHLDRLRFVPQTNFQTRPDAEFARLHAEAIAKDSWVMEGNYSSLLPPRLERCTGLILLNENRWVRLLRYAQRIATAGKTRHGAPEGAREIPSLEMVGWVLNRTHANPKRYSDFAKFSGKPHVECLSASKLKALYQTWDIPAPMR